MSVCDPNNACDRCTPVDCGPDLFMPEPTQLSEEQRRELEDMETRLKALRLEARALKRSGHPGVKAEGTRSEAYIDDQLAWVRGELSKDQPDV